MVVLCMYVSGVLCTLLLLLLMLRSAIGRSDPYIVGFHKLVNIPRTASGVIHQHLYRFVGDGQGRRTVVVSATPPSSTTPKSHSLCWLLYH